jgi:hypothetical protein
MKDGSRSVKPNTMRAYPGKTGDHPFHLMAKYEIPCKFTSTPQYSSNGKLLSIKVRWDVQFYVYILLLMDAIDIAIKR